uniref:T5orf172 domain-containing protein n=1 Tax=Ascaris lumbricoides TaxID=6252 RepID=A0A0M3HR89_ASCLU
MCCKSAPQSTPSLINSALEVIKQIDMTSFAKKTSAHAGYEYAYNLKCCDNQHGIIVRIGSLSLEARKLICTLNQRLTSRMYASSKSIPSHDYADPLEKNLHSKKLDGCIHQVICCGNPASTRMRLKAISSAHSSFQFVHTNK